MKVTDEDKTAVEKIVTRGGRSRWTALGVAKTLVWRRRTISDFGPSVFDVFRAERALTVLKAEGKVVMKIGALKTWWSRVNK